MSFSPVPPEIKPVAHLMKLAAEHDSRNIVVAYWGTYKNYWMLIYYLYLLSWNTPIPVIIAQTQNVSLNLPVAQYCLIMLVKEICISFVFIWFFFICSTVWSLFVLRFEERSCPNLDINGVLLDIKVFVFQFSDYYTFCNVGGVSLPSSISNWLMWF